MRNLTLGVLIVSGGTLAALPFRRVPDYVAPTTIDVPPGAVLNAAAGPATGPTHKMSNLVQLQASTVPPSLRTDFTEDLVLETTTIDAFDTESFESFSWNKHSESASRLSHRGEAFKPLTYEDLAVPISRPSVVNDRYSATAPAFAQAEAQRNAQVAGEAVAKMNPIEAGVSSEAWQRPSIPPTAAASATGSLAATESLPSFQAASRFAQVNPAANPSLSSLATTSQGSATAAGGNGAGASATAPARQNATLASSPRRESDPLLPAPAPQPAERIRQWITQPE